GPFADLRAATPCRPATFFRVRRRRQPRSTLFPYTTLFRSALEIDGTFDDCQAMVKQAFNDADLKEILCLTSANSINIARLIPQRSEEDTSELQSRENLVCRLLLEKKNYRSCDVVRHDETGD